MMLNPRKIMDFLTQNTLDGSGKLRYNTIVTEYRLDALFRLAFASAAHLKMLNLAGKSNS